MANMLLISSSRTSEQPRWLESSAREIQQFFKDRKIRKATFVPYAATLSTHQEYTEMIRRRFAQEGICLDSVSEGDPAAKIANAEAIIVGGGNTSMLVKLLHETGIIEAIRERVLHAGVPYFGWSAGTTIAGPSMRGAATMPIVLPPSLDSLCLLSTDISPHFPDPVTRKYESDMRRKEIMGCTGITQRPMIALGEGSMLRLMDKEIHVEGASSAYYFAPGCKEPTVYTPGTKMPML